MRAAICAPWLRGYFLSTPTTQEFDLAYAAIRVNLVVHTRSTLYTGTTPYRAVSAIPVARREYNDGETRSGSSD